MPIKCCYVNCCNTNETHSMFRFPVKDLERLQTWIKNSGNIHLTYLEKDGWRNRFLCSVHFDSAYLNKTYARTRVMATAVPRPYKCNKGETIDDINLKSPATEADSVDFTVVLPLLPDQKVYKQRSYHTIKEKKAETSSCQDLSVSDGELNMPLSKKQKLDNNCMDEKCVKTRRLLQACRKSVIEQTAQIKWFSNKLDTNNLYQHKYPSAESKAIVHMQLRGGGEMVKWKKVEKHLSLALFRESPECYSFMLNEGIVLPDLATINNWLSETACLSGVAEDGGSVKMMEEQEDDCGVSVKDHETDFRASVTEVPIEYYGTSVKEEFEDDGASVNLKGGENCGARVKDEIGKSASA